MGRLHVTLGLVAVGLAACGGSPPATPRPDDAILLRFAPPVGLVSRYRTTEQSTFDVSMPMLQGPVSTQQTEYHTYQVVDAVGDRRVIERTIDSMVVDASGAPDIFSQSMEEAVRTARGKRDTFTVDVMRRTVDEPDKATAKDVDAAAPGLDPTGLLDLLDHPMGLPEQPVRPGESWTVPLEEREQVPELGEMVVRVETTYVLDRVEVGEGSRQAFVSYDAILTIYFEPDPSAMVVMDMEFDGTETGALVLDLDAGRVVRARSTATASGAVATMGMDLTMSMELVAERVLLP